LNALEKATEAKYNLLHKIIIRGTSPEKPLLYQIKIVVASPEILQ
jgi:hypothetical protein